MTTNPQLLAIRCAQDYEQQAAQRLGPEVMAYIAGGSDQDRALERNRQALESFVTVPRLMTDLTNGSIALQMLGVQWSAPIALAPVAYQSLVHPGGETETAKAARAMDTPMVLSSLSTRTLEDVACEAGDPRWFQVYLQPRWRDTLDLVHRAHAAGYSAIVLTLDAAVQMPSRRALAAGFVMPSGCRAVNLERYEPYTNTSTPFFQSAQQARLTVSQLHDLINASPLPLLVKGVLHPDDALEVRAAGVAGVVVSNHGGRAADLAPASAWALPKVRTAVGPDYPVLFDSGIRSGADVFAALAMGADAVLVGRLQLYALAVAGALGVGHMIKLLREELQACMLVCGCATLADVRAAGVSARVA